MQLRYNMKLCKTSNLQQIKKFSSCSFLQRSNQIDDVLNLLRKDLQTRPLVADECLE